MRTTAVVFIVAVGVLASFGDAIPVRRGGVATPASNERRSRYSASPASLLQVDSDTIARIRSRDRERERERASALDAATHFWSGWDPAHPVKSLQPPWVKMDDVGDFDLPSPPNHMHPPPPPPSFWAGIVHGDSTQGSGAEAGFGGLYGFEEDRYLPPPPKPPPHVPPPIPPPPPKGPEAGGGGGDDFIERSAALHNPNAHNSPADRQFVNEFDPNSPVTAAGGVPSDPKRALIDRLSRYKPLFGQFELPANNRLWTPPADARTVGGKQPFAIPKPPPPQSSTTVPAGLTDRQFIPPHLLPGAPSATEPATALVQTVATPPAVAARFDPNLKHSS